MAQIPEERFAEILAEIREADGAYNANGVLARDLRSYEQRIERGIYQIRDGRYVLQWKHRGTKHREVLATHDIARARVELAVRTGKIQETYGQDPHTVDSVYALVRRAAQALDKIDRRDASHEAKIALNRAMPHLHRAEDELVQAINNWDAKK